MEITLSGRPIRIYHKSGMYRADVNGVHFCGSTEEGLLKALGEFHSVSVHIPDAPVHQKNWVEIILDESEPLCRKQTANLRLRDRREDPSAIEIVQKLENKKPYSQAAQEIQKRIGKDFALATHEDLAEHENNLVRRHKLMLELGEIYKLVN